MSIEGRFYHEKTGHCIYCYADAGGHGGGLCFRLSSEYPERQVPLCKLPHYQASKFGKVCAGRKP